MKIRIISQECFILRKKNLCGFLKLPVSLFLRSHDAIVSKSDGNPLISRERRTLFLCLRNYSTQFIFFHLL